VYYAEEQAFLAFISVSDVRSMDLSYRHVDFEHRLEISMEMA
jgi:hypothetical protein